MTSSSYSWSDPFQLEQQLTTEEKLIRDTAHEYAQKTLQPRVSEDFQKEKFHRSLLTDLGKLGLNGMTLPAPWGEGATPTAYGLVARELERVDSGYRSSFSVQSSLAMEAIFQFGTKDQQDAYLPKLKSGDWIGAFALTEPNHGSDPGSMEARARKSDQGGWVLNGHKQWITHAPVADILIVWAKDEEDIVRGFLITPDMKGVSAHPIHGKLSLLTSPTGDLILEDVLVPNTHFLEKSEGLKSPFQCLSNARFGIAWGALGAAENCWHTARQYTLDRKQFGVPLASKQLIQTKLTQMMSDISFALQGVLRASRLKEENQCPYPVVSLIKRNSCAVALQTARLARDMLGANGLTLDFQVMRHMVNLETVSTYEGTHDIHSLILGQSQTRQSAF
ncbi:MAG: acyl-CoA dehydrogenase [bacterium]|nr:acyl-CoA dehydrogenase [bacterium]